MKRYSVFELWVVEKDNHKFICEYVCDNIYKEVLTKEKIKIDDNDVVESLRHYYSILCVANYKTEKPLMLSKKDILLKYISINKKIRTKEVNIDDFLKKQQELKALARECPDLAKQKALQTLQRIGILDKEGNLIGPYNEILVKEETPKQKILKNEEIDN